LDINSQMQKIIYYVVILVLISNQLYATNDEQSISTLQVDVKIIEKNELFILTATNHFFIPIQLVIYNRANNTIKQEHLIQPNSQVDLLTFEKQDKVKLSEKLNKEYSLKYFYGDQSKISHNDNYLYRLPFQEGKKYRVSQSYNGKFTHNTDKSRYAIDFKMKIGEQVHAARGGLVVRTIDRFKDHGGSEFINKANLITIQHEDGTLGSYFHLDYKGVLVSVGDKVERGQLIGYSGLTGFTRGPHLHFVVNEKYNVSVPIFFEGYENKVLKKRKKYKIIKNSF